MFFVWHCLDVVVVGSIGEGKQCSSPGSGTRMVMQFVVAIVADNNTFQFDEKGDEKVASARVDAPLPVAIVVGLFKARIQ